MWDLGSAQGAALLNQEITRQARIIAYVDDFKLMLMLAVVAVPLLLLTRPPSSGTRSPPSRSTND
jgi:DHA2 family multidrug resistance protein